MGRSLMVVAMAGRGMNTSSQGRVRRKLQLSVVSHGDHDGVAFGDKVSSWAEPKGRSGVILFGDWEAGMSTSFPLEVLNGAPEVVLDTAFVPSAELRVRLLSSAVPSKSRTMREISAVLPTSIVDLAKDTIDAATAQLEAETRLPLENIIGGQVGFGSNWVPLRKCALSGNPAVDAKGPELYLQVFCTPDHDSIVPNLQWLLRDERMKLLQLVAGSPVVGEAPATPATPTAPPPPPQFMTAGTPAGTPADPSPPPAVRAATRQEKASWNAEQSAQYVASMTAQMVAAMKPEQKITYDGLTPEHQARVFSQYEAVRLSQQPPPPPAPAPGPTAAGTPAGTPAQTPASAPAPASAPSQAAQRAARAEPAPLIDLMNAAPFRVNPPPPSPAAQAGPPSRMGNGRSNGLYDLSFSNDPVHVPDAQGFADVEPRTPAARLPDSAPALSNALNLAELFGSSNQGGASPLSKYVPQEKYKHQALDALGPAGSWTASTYGRSTPSRGGLNAASSYQSPLGLKQVGSPLFPPPKVDMKTMEQQLLSDLENSLKF